MRFFIISISILFSLYGCQSGIPRISDLDNHPDLSKTVRKFEEETNSFWLNIAKDIVNDHISRQENKNRAKNVIMFLGDGLSHTTVGK
jgi:alkaline phosphatase